MENKRKMRVKIFVLLFALLILIIPFFSVFSFTAYAEDSVTYSSVLEDLQKDETFNVEDYPLVENDYSLQVIQIAESVNGELFVYVYQPSGEQIDLQATSINISTNEEDLFFIKYNLSLIHSTNVFYKYKVENFVVSEEDKRTYNISSIFRNYDSRFDEPTSDGQTISEVPYGVSQIWTATTDNGVVSYEREDMQTIQIESKYVGFIRYTDWFVYWLTGEACDSHFVAFSTDHDIDKLYEADISYIKRTYKMTHDTGILGGGVTIPPSSYEYVYGTPIPVTDTLKYTESVEVVVGEIVTTRFSWDRIEKVSDFLAEEYISENITNSAKEAIQEKDWVLRFYESDYEVWADSVGTVVVTEYETGERVSDVTVLRLKFETDGIVYNLGVIDNVQTGSDKPSNDMPNTPWDNFLKALPYVFGGLAGIILLLLLWPFIPTILSAIWTVIKYILKGIWWLITAPFSIFDD